TSGRTRGMDKAISPVKPVKHSQPRAANKEGEHTKSVPHTKENLSAARNEHAIGSQGGGGPSKTSTEPPQEKRRGRGSRLTRLTGRTSSGETGKGIASGSQSVTQTSASSPPQNRETSPPVVPEEVLTQQNTGWSRASAKDQFDVKSAELIYQSADQMRSAVEGQALAEQQLGLRQAEERLYRDYIQRLLKQSPEYPNYQYLCNLCSVHIENIQGAHKHIKEKRHKKNIMEKQEENELRALPPPSAAQLRAVDAAVMETARQQGISEEDFEVRQAVVVRMEDIIKRNLSDCALRLYGSCLTQFAFKTSDINIDVTHPSSMTQPEVLIQVLDILKKSPDFSEVESDFHAKVPAIFCRDVSSDLMCKVSAGNDVACLTTNHLATLAKLEPRLVPLVMAFRYWGRLCHIDCQAEGGIPSYSFALMVIFFLQQRKEPILPVYLGRWIEGFEVKRVDEYHLTGIVMDMFVRWEHRAQSSTDGRGDGRHETKAEARSKAEKNKLENSHNSEGLTNLTLNQGKGVTLGQLWLELLRFYTLEFALEEHIISIRLKEPLSRELKNWPRRRLAIEDPFALKRNVARSLNSQMVFEYIQERFRTAYKYFACPQKRGAAGRQRNKWRMERRKAEAPSPGLRGSKDEEEPESDDEGGSRGSRKAPEKNIDGSLMDMVLNERNRLSSPNGLLDSDEEEEEVEHTDGVKQDLHYVFDRMIFTEGKPPTVVCSICKRDGHLKDECPEDFKKIELKTLPPMNDRFREILDGLCKLCYYELSPSHSEQQKREQILVGLERFIRKEYNDKAQLCLFGSSKNGFGFRDSDLDICMTLEGHDSAENLNCKEIIEGLAKVLKKHAGLRNILPITTAKVPIVKFEHRQSGLEGDISLYNTLAQHNTRMLATYAALDPRVQFLGYTMKVFAKRCDIGDASRGSLSSYAYILMVLYFLQQRQPPVIPVLQEIFDGEAVPERMVDGWNAFFFNDLEDLRRHLSEHQPNTESVGELWLGLLRFYTEDFDFKEHVISIRQKKRLTTFEKQWTSKCIAIEDPFDLNHNLGAGVSRKMTNFIMKAFINGRKLFGSPFYPPPGTEVDYFFDSKVLTDGELAPNDRCCRICGKIGHYMKDCPKRRRMKKKENDKDEDVKDEERELKERRCFQCGDKGHVRRDCPEYRHLKQRTAGVPAAHMVRTMVSSQSIPVPQTRAECTGRSRQTSECSDSRQTPPYSPQSSSQLSSQCSSASSHSKTSPAPPQKPPAHPQVQLPLFSFPTAHPGQFSPGALAALGLLPSPQAPSQPHLAHGPPSSSSWPHPSSSTTGSGGSPSPVNLNDPSIIFAQPAGRQLSMGGGGREAHWPQNHHVAPPLMANGTVVKTESGHMTQFGAVSQSSRHWDQNKAPPHFSPSPSWPYRIPQGLLQHGKPFIAPGSMVRPNPNFPMVPHIRHPVNLNFIQQKK
ncbi:terminal uridylyltransferase 4, partial [Gouania willdenowi]|uniref:terminal uridylyltransferase 4 n=1 Tax=Gouania willdenowi TaxID=441366 RepID=UPI001055DE9B